MAQRNVYHVTPSPDGRWIARLNDEGENHLFGSREAALAEARQSATRAGDGEVFIHRPDGSVEERLQVSDGRREERTEATPSKAAIMGHPIHPMLIPFPIAFLAAVPVADIVFAFLGSSFWAEAAFVLLVAGIVMGAVAALVGMVDFVGIKTVRKNRTSWFHVFSNTGALALAVVNVLIRLGERADAILPAGIILSLVTAGLLVAGGWFGGELSYRHRIGVTR